MSESLSSPEPSLTLEPTLRSASEDSNETKRRRKSRRWIGAWRRGKLRKGSLQVTASELERREWAGATKLSIDVGDTVSRQSLKHPAASRARVSSRLAQVVAVAISADDKLFAAGGVNKMLNVYSSTNGTLVQAFLLPAVINAICFSESGESTRLFVGTFGGILHCKHVRNGRELGSVKFSNGAPLVWQITVTMCNVP